MYRAEANCSLLRRTTPLITTARTETVARVSSSMSGTASGSVLLYSRSTMTASIDVIPVRTVLASEKNGAAISGAATNSGMAVKVGGVKMSNSSPPRIIRGGSARTNRRVRAPLPTYLPRRFSRFHTCGLLPGTRAAADGTAPHPQAHRTGTKRRLLVGQWRDAEGHRGGACAPLLARHAAKRIRPGTLCACRA